MRTDTFSVRSRIINPAAYPLYAESFTAYTDKDRPLFVVEMSRKPTLKERVNFINVSANYWRNQHNTTGIIFKHFFLETVLVLGPTYKNGIPRKTFPPKQALSELAQGLVFRGGISLSRARIANGNICRYREFSLSWPGLIPVEILIPNGS